MLQLEQLSFQYLDKAVLHDVSFTVEEGQFVAILGPSGSGKSTLLHLVGGLLSPASGSLTMNGTAYDAATGGGKIAYMPQQPALLPWLTSLENVELALRLSGMSKHDAHEQALHGLEQLELSAEASAYPHTLSGGMQQRVSFARALLAPQPLLALDEPFGALDAITRLEVQQWLLTIWERHQRAVLLVTHSIDEALLLADKIVVLSARPGRIVGQLAVPFARPRREQIWRESRFVELKEQLLAWLGS